VLGILLVVAEVMIPSGGVLTVLAVGSLVCAVMLAFADYGVEYGVVLLAVLVVSLPVAVSLALRWWPKTPLGRDMILEPPSPEDTPPGTSKQQQLQQLVGLTGQAKTRLLPGGMVCVDGMTVSAVAEGGPIEAGQAVRVVGVRTGCVVVRAAEGASRGQQRAEGLS